MSLYKRTLRFFEAMFFSFAVLMCGSNVYGAQADRAAGAGPDGQAAIVNNQLQRDGAAWAPKGFFQVAFEAGPGVTQLPFEANANSGYTPREYADMAGAKADSVRLMISQPGADPQNALYSQALVARFIGAVHAARAAGLSVIVGIQDEKLTGETQVHGLPGPATLRVWRQLVPPFKNDKGVLFEMFNEPFIPNSTSGNKPTATEWQMWQKALNATIANMRSQGATNVVIADGLVLGRILTGAPTLTDPLNQVAYAAHPYSLSASDETTGFLDLSFGNFAAAHPVIITEWGQGYSCLQKNNAFAAKDPKFLITFLNYLQKKGIGLEMGTWDWGGSASFGNVRYLFPAHTTVSAFHVNGTTQVCGDADRGPGKTILTWYATGKVPPSAL